MFLFCDPYSILKEEIIKLFFINYFSVENHFLFSIGIHSSEMRYCYNRQSNTAQKKKRQAILLYTVSDPSEIQHVFHCSPKKGAKDSLKKHGCRKVTQLRVCPITKQQVWSVLPYFCRACCCWKLHWSGYLTLNYNPCHGKKNCTVAVAFASTLNTKT